MISAYATKDTTSSDDDRSPNEQTSISARRRNPSPALAVRGSARVTFFRVFAIAAQASALSAILAAAHAVSAVPPPAPLQSSIRSRDVSMSEYREHLTSLAPLVEACAKARDFKNCDPALVGPDDRVPLADSPNADRRIVRYGWLRVLFSQAEEADQPATKQAKNQRNDSNSNPALPPRPTTSQLLQDAKTRLANDLAQANGSAPVPSMHPHERDTLNQVLAGPEFRNLQQETAKDSMLEKFGNWLNRLIESAANFKARSAWVGRVIVWGFILAVCVGLVWGLLQLERRWRIRLTPDTEQPASGAASARDWQLWLEDARAAAAAGLWREAIHFVYWASISRLESRRLWPADRACTPREYLALIAPEDPRKPGLAKLTGDFERTWYGGRAAGEGDYKSAENLASALISRSTAAASVDGPAVSDGGAR